MLHLCVSSRPTLVPGTWLDQARAGELASFDEAAETCPNKGQYRIHALRRVKTYTRVTIGPTQVWLRESLLILYCDFSFFVVRLK